MENRKGDSIVSFSRPQKFILHMARRGKEWTGKIQSFDWKEEFKFASLEDLREWLNKRYMENKAK